MVIKTLKVGLKTIKDSSRQMQQLHEPNNRSVQTGQVNSVLHAQAMLWTVAFGLSAWWRNFLWRLFETLFWELILAEK